MITTEDMEKIFKSCSEKVRHRHAAAKSMRDLANEIRSPDRRMVSTDGAIARIAEAVAVLLEDLPS